MALSRQAHEWHVTFEQTGRNASTSATTVSREVIVSRDGFEPTGFAMDGLSEEDDANFGHLEIDSSGSSAEMQFETTASTQEFLGVGCADS